MNSEYAKKHWVKQGVSGYPTPSELRHRWRLKLMSWEKFWDWQWPIVVLIICGIYLSISLTGCTTVEKTNEENCVPQQNQINLAILFLDFFLGG